MTTLLTIAETQTQGDEMSQLTQDVFKNVKLADATNLQLDFGLCEAIIKAAKALPVPENMKGQTIETVIFDDAFCFIQTYSPDGKLINRFQAGIEKLCTDLNYSPEYGRQVAISMIAEQFGESFRFPIF